MKVILVNGGPHKEGCTYTALREVADALEQNGIETEIFWLGNDPVAGCIDCGYCKKRTNASATTASTNSLKKLLMQTALYSVHPYTSLLRQVP